MCSLLHSHSTTISEGVVNTGTLRCLSVNMEIVRCSSLILFCDYVVSITCLLFLDQNFLSLLILQCISPSEKENLVELQESNTSCIIIVCVF
jgi:hypothetical protein